MDIHIDKPLHQPFAVLVFASLGGAVLWVKHPKRGWEVPGGKVDPGETPTEAALREVFEESGALLEDLTWMAEYPTADGHWKWAYLARIKDVQARPEDSEIEDVWIPRPMIDPDQAKQRADVSFIMQDAMYETLWPQVVAWCQEVDPL